MKLGDVGIINSMQWATAKRKITQKNNSKLFVFIFSREDARRLIAIATDDATLYYASGFNVKKPPQTFPTQRLYDH